jgi:hypothetical protein
MIFWDFMDNMKMGITRIQKEYQYGMKEGFDWV